MKLKLCYFVMLMTALVSTAPVTGQELQQPSEVELMTKHYADAYDSLINSYYLRQFAHSRLLSSRSFSEEEFDAIPDSVIARRLHNLRTVVPMTFNSEVRSYIRFYLKYMSRRLDVMLSLCQYYHPLFQDALGRYGVPDELKYLTIVESAMNPMATSRVGAAGLWQFMFSTGALFGLEVNSVIDERRDVHKSTYAAANYLSKLYNDVFHDWTLAIAAYNCGPGNINKAVARSGGKRDFWEIYYFLPRETRGYIPAFIAVNYVMNYYHEHGLRPEVIKMPLHTDTLMVNHDVLMTFVEEYLGMESDELHTLNPQYRVGYIPGASGPYSLCLPTSKVELFIANQDSIYARSADSLSRRPVNVEPVKGKGAKGVKGSKGGGEGRYHTVKKGETLSSISRKYGISVSKLKKLNGLKRDQIGVGQRLKVRG